MRNKARLIATGILGGGGAAWTPLSESNIMFWYDFSNEDEGLDADAEIETRLDKSGNDRTLTFDATKRPLNKLNILHGLAGAKFDGSNDAGYTSAFAWGANKVTVYAVISGLSGTGDKLIVEFGPSLAGADGRWVLYKQNAGAYLAGGMRNNSQYATDIGTTSLQTLPFLVSAVIDETVTDKVSVYVNNTAEGTPTNAAVGTANFGTEPIYIGARANSTTLLFNGYLHELIGYAAAHDAATRARVWAYLMDRWGGPPFNLGVSAYSDNAYAVIGTRSDGGSFVKSSPGARVIYNTDAETAYVYTYNDIYGAYPTMTDIGVRVNGVDLTAVNPGAAGNAFEVVDLGAGANKRVEFINGLQSGATAAERTGTYIYDLAFNKTATLAAKVTSPRLVVYGDSISVGANCDNPSLEGCWQLVRNDYSGSLIIEGRGYRSLYEDCPDAAGRTSFAEYLATLTPDIIWLAIGLNDYILETQNAANFQTAYADLLDKIHAEMPAAVIYAQTMLVKSASGANSLGSTLADYRTAISNAQSTRSAYCTLVDGTALCSLGNLDGDGVHPNVAGHAEIAVAVSVILGL